MRFLTRTETHLINSKYVLWSVRRSSRRQDNKKKGGGTYGCLQFVEEKKVHCFVELSDSVDNSGCLWEFLEIILIYLFWYFCLELNRKMTLQVFVATWLSIIIGLRSRKMTKMNVWNTNIFKNEIVAFFVIIIHFLKLIYRVLFSRDDKTTPALFVLRYD